MSISIQNLVKDFGAYRVLSHISFNVEAGEFVTLLGPSGSGKSTVLRCIAGLEHPDQGEIFIQGQNVIGRAVQKRQIGFVFQHYALFKHMTVLENIAFGLKVRKVNQTDRFKIAQELLELVGLSKLGNRMPTELSGGQRQRVALARALAPEPELLLLDEPFGALDSLLRKELRVWLKELHRKIKLTTLLVTHDQEEAFELSDRVIVMNQGRIEQDAIPQEIFDRPATHFVAQFVGESNTASGVVREGTVAWGPFRFKAIHLPEQAMAQILFRPSDVYVSSQREAGGFPGEIIERQFMGATVVLNIQVDQVRLQAHIPKGVAELSHFHPGKAVYVMITQSHAYSTARP